VRRAQENRETRALVTVFPSLRHAMVERPPRTLAVAVKAYDVEDLAGAIADTLAHLHYGNPPPAIVCLTNGVGAEELLAAMMPASIVFPATLTAAVKLDQPGAVRMLGRGGIALASPIDDGRRSGAPAALLGALRRADLPTRLVNDGRSLKWSKLLLNMVAAASSAALDWLPHKVMSHPGLLRMEERAWREALSVMRGSGISPVDLPGYRVGAAARLVNAVPNGWARPLFAAAGRGRGDRAPGPLADLRLGKKRTEIEWMHGAVARQGSRVAIETPVNTALASVVEAIASGQLAWDELRGRPDALLARVTASERSAAGTVTDDETTSTLEEADETDVRPS
jgi:2-dehydropantoate 2-reductase